jgi:class III lanthionine synthetase
VLTDLRWRSGPLYVRYGAFLERYCKTEKGELVFAIADPQGRLVPDVKRPVFTMPDWVTPPAFLADELRRRQQRVEGFPYRIERPLHFSNAGGLYLAEEIATGRTVVLKEARPFAGLDSDGVDAVTRLRREWKMLEELSFLEVVPEVVDYFTAAEHDFLVLEYIDGQELNKYVSRTNPLVWRDSTREELASYTSWALDTFSKIESALAAIHRHGIILGDLHWSNILVRPDGRIVFVDFEQASHVDEERSPSLGDPGFAAPRELTGFDIDLYALARLGISMFIPMITAFAIFTGNAEDKNRMLARAIGERFPVPPEFVDGITARLRPSSRGPLPAATAAADRMIDELDHGKLTDWTAFRERLAEAILASATPDRDDRLFPGDIDQFAFSGVCFSYGASGVLYALAATGNAIREEHAEWLLRAVRAARSLETGFYNGLHGIAYVLDHIGRRDEAIHVLEHALDHGLPEHRLDLSGGLAGVGLNLLHFAALTGDQALQDAALKAADQIATRLDALPPGGHLSTRESPAGLLLGFAGPALFFIRLYESTGDRQFLDLATTTLQRDLGCCVTSAEGTFVYEGWRKVPYVKSGSAGIGLVLAELIAYRHDEEHLLILDGIRRAMGGEYVAFPGLFNGRAGLMACLNRLRDEPGQDGTKGQDAFLRRHVRRLAWHAVPYRGGVAFAGEQLLRLSMDLGTGTAGVLLVLGAVLDGARHLPLPFLNGTARPATGSLEERR